MAVLLHNLQITVTLLIVLSILVVAHEWGHFIIARLFGIRVDDFSIGFGKRLLRLGKRGDTEYNLRMLPLGGFVKIAGMEADEEPLLRARDKVHESVLGKGGNSDPDAREIPLVAENTPESVPYTAPDGFNSKPVWQRSLVILAGPVMSFVLGYIILCLIGVTTGWPTGKLLNKVDLVAAGGEGQRIGLRSGDIITAINGAPITDGEQMVSRINNSLGKPVTLTVRRDGQTLTLTGTPGLAKDDATGKVILNMDVVTPGPLGTALGLQTGDTLLAVNHTKVTTAAQFFTLLRSHAGKKLEIIVTRGDALATLTPTVPNILSQNLPTLSAHPIGVLKILPAAEIIHYSLRESIHQGNLSIVGIFKGLGTLLQHHELQKNAGGIIFMYQATGLAVQGGPLSPESLFKVVSLMAQLSISLAIFNLLPIPILDGGHLLTFFIEWARGGRKLTPQQQQNFMMAGLAIIFSLFILVMWNDITRTLRHQLPQ